MIAARHGLYGVDYPASAAVYAAHQDEADRLYFEELGFERVMDIYELEQAHGVIVSVGGMSGRLVLS